MSKTPNLDSQNLQGQIIDDRYEIIEKIARGGMATVYKAKDIKFGRVVALKIIHRHLIEGDNSQEFVERFVREAKAAGGLDHPNIVKIHETGIWDGQNYIVMQYINGTTLRSLLNQVRVLDVFSTLTIILNILKGLDYAHKKGIIHRDIKPENIMIDSDGHVYIADFGLAKPIQDDHFTQTGTILGTVAYIAPEAVETENFSVQSDLYAVGIMMYELLVGKVPFSGKTPYITLSMHTKHNVPNIHTSYPQIHEFVSNIVVTLCEKDLSLRFPSAKKAKNVVEHVQTILNPIERKAKTVALVDQEQVTEKMSGLAKPNISLAFEINDNLTQENIMLDKANHTIERKRKKGKIAKIMFPIILISLLGIAILWFSFFGPGSYKNIPQDLINLNPSQAQSKLEELGFSTNTIQNYSATISKGLVMDTDPKPGSNVQFRNQQVTIIISKGIQYLNFPTDIIGSTLQDSKDELTQMGYIVKLDYLYSLIVKKGLVIDTSIVEGSKIAFGTTVTLDISKGPEPHNMPNVIGHSKSEAIQTLKALNFKVKAIGKYSDEIPEGEVMSQDIVEGKQIFEGDTVTITVSKGPPYVSMPNLVGNNVQEAHNILDKLGLKYNDLGSEVLHLVQKQSIKKGERVRIGTVVSLKVV